MALRSQKKPLGLVLLVLVLGMLIGSLMGTLISEFMVDGVVKDFFTRSITPGFTPTTLDLVVLRFTLGLTIELNVISIVGVVLAAYLLRWYE
ncbi:MAG: hypothetical protein CME06_14725 [Gemmatimonadetes bacterium]|nr:hypothetical protein [Gemmatimonadota bacterium]